MSRLLHPRVALAEALLGRVAGPDAEGARDRIHRAPGPRWFAPDSAIARVHGDSAMFVGGMRALLLQSLHPRVMRAVAEHSGYRSDPWGRLQNTATFLATTTFGPSDDAARSVRIVRAVHRRVFGTTADGTPYAASDPRLLAWVHVAEADSFLRAHQRLGRRPLDRAGCEEYLAQSAEVARAVGAQDVPTTLPGLRSALQEFRGELAGTPEARDVAAFLLHTPPLPRSARPGYALIAGGAVSLLPPWARRELGLPVRQWADPLRSAGAHVVSATIRWALDPVERADGTIPRQVVVSGPATG